MTRSGRALVLLLALAALAAASAELRVAYGRSAASGPPRTLHGSASPSGTVALTLNGDRLTAVKISGLPAPCSTAWSFVTPSSAASLTGLHVSRQGSRFVATGSQRGSYPDGSLGWAGRASVTGSVGRAAHGTVEESLTLYAEGSVSGRCSTGPVPFTAR